MGLRIDFRHPVDKADAGAYLTHMEGRPMRMTKQQMIEHYRRVAKNPELPIAEALNGAIKNLMDSGDLDLPGLKALFPPVPETDEDRRTLARLEGERLDPEYAEPKTQDWDRFGGFRPGGEIL